MNVPLVISVDPETSESLLEPGRPLQAYWLGIDDPETWRFIACMTRPGDEVTVTAADGTQFPAVITDSSRRLQAVEVFA